MALVYDTGALLVTATKIGAAVVTSDPIDIRHLADAANHRKPLRAVCRVGRAADRVRASSSQVMRLIHTAGMHPAAVAALDLEQAVDRWTDYTSQSRPTDA